MASFSQSEEQHVKHLNWVIGALNQVNLKLGREMRLVTQNSQFLLTSFPETQSVLILSLLRFRSLFLPTTGQQLESFFGNDLLFVRLHSTFLRIAATLERIRKTKVLSRMWTPECDEAFETLKKVLCQPTILSMP